MGSHPRYRKWLLREMHTATQPYYFCTKSMNLTVELIAHALIDFMNVFVVEYTKLLYGLSSHRDQYSLSFHDEKHKFTQCHDPLDMIISSISLLSFMSWSTLL